MKALTATLVAVLALGAGLIAPSMAPCATEDQTTACYWDAGTRSNGAGQSFIVTITGDVIYFS
jgi:hypothetical protein